MEPCWVWVSTLRTSVIHGKKRRFVDEELGDTADNRAGHVVGLARVKLDAVLDNMVVLTQHDRTQIDFYQDLMNMPLLGSQFDSCVLVSLRVTDILAFGQSVPLQQISRFKFKGFVQALESGQPSRLAEMFSPLPFEHAPSFTLRLPPRFARRCVSGELRCVLVPHAANEKRSEFSLPFRFFGSSLEHLL